MTHEHGEVEMNQRPRKSGVERATVAVTTKVDRDRVIAEGRDLRRNLVEHASVVVGTVQQQHWWRTRISPTPQPQVGAVHRN